LKFYDFLDKAPAIGKLVVIEGTEHMLAQRALEKALDRLLPQDVRDLNLVRFRAADVGDGTSVREAVQAMPFLAERRVVVVSDAHQLRAQERRDLWAAAQSVPEGNTLVISDLLSPRSARPESLGAVAGRAALRIDTTANVETRHRFIQEALAELGATAEPAVISSLVESSADLGAIQNDLAKLALGKKKIRMNDLERESLHVADPKAYRYASALAEGKTGQAFAIVQEMFFLEPRGAAMPLLSALAAEYALLWDLARPGGQIAPRLQWRERILRPIARRIGEERARMAYGRAVQGMQAIVTGRIGSDPAEYQALVECVSAECALLTR
jgi:DNA polymerase-3 subunit delta